MPCILPSAMPKLVAQITLVMPAAFECELREQRLREAIAQGAVSGIVTFDKITCSRLLPARNSLIQKSMILETAVSA